MTWEVLISSLVSSDETCDTCVRGGSDLSLGSLSSQVVKHWNRLPSLPLFKTHLDNAINNML